MFTKEELSSIIEQIKQSTKKEDLELKKKLCAAISTMGSIAKA